MEFKWMDYEIPVQARALAAIIPLPDLTEWPTPRGKAEILLQTAAEVEHALMVQYLYAAYSLRDADEVTDPGQRQVLSSRTDTAWPQLLRGIAREEMGHLMTVQNLLLLLGLGPYFEREDFPPRKQLYPFPLHLERLSQRSLAKYVVAEAPVGALGIDDIVAVATQAAGAGINRVGVLYGLLGLVFCTADQVEAGATGDPDWDGFVCAVAAAAGQQAPPEAWHLGDDDFHPDSVAQQADPAAWLVGNLRVHRMTARPDAVQAIRDVCEQGAGPVNGGGVRQGEDTRSGAGAERPLSRAQRDVRSGQPVGDSPAASRCVRKPVPPNAWRGSSAGGPLDERATTGRRIRMPCERGRREFSADLNISRRSMGAPG